MGRIVFGFDLSNALVCDVDTYRMLRTMHGRFRFVPDGTIPSSKAYDALPIGKTVSEILNLTHAELAKLKNGQIVDVQKNGETIRYQVFRRGQSISKLAKLDAKQPSLQEVYKIAGSMNIFSISILKAAEDPADEQEFTLTLSEDFKSVEDIYAIGDLIYSYFPGLKKLVPKADTDSHYELYDVDIDGDADLFVHSYFIGQGLDSEVVTEEFPLPNGQLMLTPPKL